MPPWEATSAALGAWISPWLPLLPHVAAAQTQRAAPWLSRPSQPCYHAAARLPAHVLPGSPVKFGDSATQEQAARKVSIAWGGVVGTAAGHAGRLCSALHCAPHSPHASYLELSFKYERAGVKSQSCRQHSRGQVTPGSVQAPSFAAAPASCPVARQSEAADQPWPCGCLTHCT